MIDFRPLLFIIGLLLCALGTLMLLPAVVDAAIDNPDWAVFVSAAGFTLSVGAALIISQRDLHDLSLDRRQTFLLTNLCWVTLAAFGAVPFLFFSGKLSYADAFFESISGLTTTGATIFVGLDAMPPGILLWRAVLQWLGGIGIIIMAIAFLPFLRVGGMQLLRTESSDKSDKALPRAGAIAAITVIIYSMLTLLCALLYYLGGMGKFDALTHAMTTLSTGGFSTSDQSMGHFGPGVQWVAICFMMLGGLPFGLYIYVLKGQPRRLWQSSEARTFLGLLAALILFVGLWLWMTLEMPFLDGLRIAAFNVTSILTTTGYASEDYIGWGPFAAIFFFVLTFVGGCAGSTAGGIKILRLEVLILMTKSQLTRTFAPHRVYPLKYGDQPLDTAVMISVTVFVTSFIGTFIAFTLALASQGLDFVTAASGAATALANVGPGLGEIIGPAGTYAPLSDAAKWLLSTAMLLGRLELFTVLVLFQSSFWVA